MDLEFIETGNGGDLVKTVNDLSVIYGFENMPYLGLFGGNPEESTGIRQAGHQAFDYWANSLLDSENPDRQMNSLTERVINTVALGSQGRIDILNAVRKDLAFMSPFASVGVDVVIVGVDKIAIGIKIIRLDNLQEREFIYLWDATIQELTAKERGSTSSGSTPVSGDSIFDITFDYQFG